VNGIVRVKGVCLGRPVVRGTQVEPITVFNLFMRGLPIHDEEYQGLSHAQVFAAIRFVCASHCPCSECLWAKGLPMHATAPAWEDET